MELQEGHLYVHLELGSGAVKVKASRYELNDGSWHKVALTLRKQQGRISIDGDTEAFETPGNFDGHFSSPTFLKRLLQFCNAGQCT